MTSRREFVRMTVATGSMLGLGGIRGSAEAAWRRIVPPSSAPLRVLILGGTGFIGPHQVRYALSRGHQLTLFNRGRTSPGLFPEVENLVGDRDGDLEALKGRDWDVVIDNSGYVPRLVGDSARLLEGYVGRYLFISTLSVYDFDLARKGLDEDDATTELEDPATEEVGRFYGGLKALCERVVLETYGDRGTIIRPGLIVGPGDRTDRFTYWPVRIDRGGEVMAPGDPTDPVLFIDARDLAEFCVHMLENGEGGIYNTVGPHAEISIAEMLYGIRAITSADVRFTWLDNAFLQEHDVRAWADMPVWTHPDGPIGGMGYFNRDRAIAKGLTFRSLAVTAKDTLDWHKTRPPERQQRLRAGITPEREAEVLAAWHERHG